MNVEELLPTKLVEKASLRGNEYAWKIEHIPEVIEVARDLGLLNIGGQLQFRFPQETCECYWIEVDVLRCEGLSDLSWEDKVSKASTLAQNIFKDLQAKYDFLYEGRKAFTQAFEKYEKNGNNPEEAMFFVWYLEKKN